VCPRAGHFLPVQEPGVFDKKLWEFVSGTK
jgi:hypothetical protein